MNNLFFAKHDDKRGSHMKFFTKESSNDVGFGTVHEIFMTTNNKNTLRGLHRQTGDNPQQKVIKPVNGHFNVRVVFPTQETEWSSQDRDGYDVVRTSKDFIIEEYNNIDANHAPIFVPKNALLGYVSLEDNSKMLYIADNDFSGEDDDGFNAFDENINVDWGIDETDAIRNDRDLEAQNFTKE